MTWFIIIISLGLIGIIANHFQKQKAKAQDLKALEESGLDMELFIPAGIHAGGFPGIEPGVKSLRFYPTEIGINLYGSKDNEEDYGIDYKIETSVISSMKGEDIRNIEVEDKSTFEKRLSVTNIGLFGPLGLAMRKGQQKEGAGLIITFIQGRFEGKAYFYMSGPGAFKRAAASRQKLVSHLNKISDGKA